MRSRKQEKGRCCIANPNFIPTTSTLYLCSSFLKTPKNDEVFERKGCVLFLSFGEAR
jgi:hypothetical protein